MSSDIAVKKGLTATFASIPDTADASFLGSLSNMRARATPIADKLALRIQKRKDHQMVSDYGYRFDPSPLEVISITDNNKRRMQDAHLEAYTTEQAKTWTPEQQAMKIHRDRENVASKARYDEYTKQKSINTDQKEVALATWFAEFCKAIDTKVDKITANIPGYCAAIVVVPPVKKTTPTPLQVQITLAHAFKEEIIDKDTLLSNLHAQLQTAQTTETKALKTLDTRRRKNVAQRTLRNEQKVAKQEGKAFTASKQALGMIKTAHEVKTEDHVDLAFANWFQQHALAIKAKIALVESKPKPTEDTGTVVDEPKDEPNITEDTKTSKPHPPGARSILNAQWHEPLSVVEKEARALAVVVVSGTDHDVCEVCPKDMYCTDEAKTQCPTHAESDIGSDSESDCVCKPGTVKSDTDYQCSPCDPDRYCTGGTSNVECPANTESEAWSESQEDCTCVPGYYGAAGGPCEQCEAGTWCSEGKKNNCPAYENSGPGSDERSDCFCKPGSSRQEDGTCKPCAAGTYKPEEGPQQCTNCAAGTYSSSTGATSGDTCQTCPSNTESSAGSPAVNDCTCSRGHTGADGTECSSCIAGTYKEGTGSGSCVSCASNTYSATVGATSSDTCSGCPPNTRSSAGSDERNDCTCTRGYTGPDGSACSACASGEYKIITGNAACSQCEADTYSSTTAATSKDTCDTCETHSTSTKGSQEKTDCVCEAGWYGPDGGTCAYCREGNWCMGGDEYACETRSSSDAGSNEIEDCICNPGAVGANGGPCKPCTEDDYCEGGTDSKECPDFSSASPGSSSLTDCSCNPGYKGPDGGPCTECESGDVCTGGDAPAQKCPQYSTSVSGSDEMSDCKCKPGYVGDSATFDENNGECAMCEQDSYCTGGDEMTSCKADSTSQVGTNSSTYCICKAGWYAAQNGDCTLCEKGKWCHGDMEYECPRNSTTHTTGSDAIDDCVCKAGYTLASEGSCKMCPVGSYKDHIGGGTCDSCDTDTYSNANGATSSSTCQTCPSHTFSAKRSGSRTDCTCDAGYTGADGTECRACDPGTYKINTGDAGCTKCGQGTYSPTPHATTADTCSQCEDNSDSSPGTNKRSDCKCKRGYYNSETGGGFR